VFSCLLPLVNSLLVLSTLCALYAEFSANCTFDNTVQIRVARSHFFGIPLGIVPAWKDFMAMTLLVERESFAAMVASILFLIFLVLLRLSLGCFRRTRREVALSRLHSKF